MVSQSEEGTDAPAPAWIVQLTALGVSFPRKRQCQHPLADLWGRGDPVTMGCELRQVRQGPSCAVCLIFLYFASNITFT